MQTLKQYKFYIIIPLILIIAIISLVACGQQQTETTNNIPVELSVNSTATPETITTPEPTESPEEKAAREQQEKEEQLRQQAQAEQERLEALYNSAYTEAHSNPQGEINNWIDYELSILSEQEKGRDTGYKTWRITAHPEAEDEIFISTETTMYATEAIEVLSQWYDTETTGTISMLSKSDSVQVTGTGIDGTTAEGYTRVSIKIWNSDTAQDEEVVGYIKTSCLSATKPVTQAATGTGNPSGNTSNQGSGNQGSGYNGKLDLGPRGKPDPSLDPVPDGTQQGPAEGYVPGESDPGWDYSGIQGLG